MNYYDISPILDKNFTFNFVIGGRGRGKTYSTLKYIHEKKEKFVFVKRTIDEVEMLMDSNNSNVNMMLSPFKSLNTDYGWNVQALRFYKSIGGFYENDELLGYIVSLSAISKIRGFDLSDCNYIIFDEFIPEKNTRVFKDEGTALLNLYETVNRNREFKGREPVKLICLANANDLNNDTFKVLNLQPIVGRMLSREQEFSFDKERSLLIEIIPGSDEFESQKKNTALYKLSEGTAFYDMALKNEFAFEDFTLIGYKSIKGYKPIIGITDTRTTIYAWGKDDTIYWCQAKGNCDVYNIKAKHEHIALLLQLSYLEHTFITGQMVFENYTVKGMYLEARKPEPK